MEPLQKQVITLSHKVDALYQVVDQLSKMSDAFSECRLAPTGTNDSVGWTVLALPARGYRNLNRRWNTKTSWQIGLDTQRQSGERS